MRTSSRSGASSDFGVDKTYTISSSLSSLGSHGEPAVEHSMSVTMKDDVVLSSTRSESAIRQVFYVSNVRQFIVQVVPAIVTRNTQHVAQNVFLVQPNEIQFRQTIQAFPVSLIHIKILEYF
jgi:hypothetical protein